MVSSAEDNTRIFLRRARFAPMFPPIYSVCTAPVSDDQQPLTPGQRASSTLRQAIFRTAQHGTDMRLGIVPLTKSRPALV